MTPEDESELHRLSEMLAEIDATLPESSPLREVLFKSGWAIFHAFTKGRRPEIEKLYENRDTELTDAQKDHLRSMGLGR